ncbi:unnamed protein product [Fraxinus pennsylvanica]|uniref:KH type-2 domain-containing protein n=1 Tax=Fraxinus pennsylvanica TaxID=56036 RepID=A0AAD2EAL4_9LAMI|nr:unnamed protein product [Fraxinus pennsylvanica]
MFRCYFVCATIAWILEELVARISLHALALTMFWIMEPLILLPEKRTTETVSYSNVLAVFPVRIVHPLAIKRPWDEDPFAMSEEVMKNISLEIVREKLLDYVHQEIPYGVEHRLMDWKELRDGSLRIEQHFITHKISQRKILVGKKGSKIGRIGMEANEELRSIFKRNVHLILMVRVK